MEANRIPVTAHSSQRATGFNGGIQVGTTAYDEQSLKLDQLVKSVGVSYKHTHRWVPRLTGKERAFLLGVPHVTMKGISPDGGIFKNEEGNILIGVEAKKQGPVGNAIERGADNLQSLYFLGAKKYIIIACGAGFFNQCSSEKTVMGWLATYNKPKDVIFGANEGFLEVHRLFDEEVTEETIRTIFEHALKSADSQAQ